MIRNQGTSHGQEPRNKGGFRRHDQELKSKDTQIRFRNQETSFDQVLNSEACRESAIALAKTQHFILLSGHGGVSELPAWIEPF